jgi:hypothetical protein
MRFNVLTAVNIMILIFLDVTTHNLVDANQFLRGICYLPLQCFLCSEDRQFSFLENVDTYLPGIMELLH